MRKGARAGIVRAFAVGIALIAGSSLAEVQAQTGPVVTTWAMPPIAVPTAERPAAPDVFGTVALPIRARQTGTRWTKLMRASLDQPALLRLADRVRNETPLQQAAYVQVAVDRALRSRGGSQDCSDDGYWASAGETLTRGLGDCFDVAIAKMEALRSLGFAHTDLYLTTGYYQSLVGNRRGRGTAALLVRLDSGFLLLPDGPDPVIEASFEGDRFGSYKPYITYGYGMTWVHGRVLRGEAAAAALASRSAAVSLAR